MTIVQIKDILLGQFDDSGQFVRYDLIIKYLFLKEYHKQKKPKDFRFKLYDTLFTYKHTRPEHIDKSYQDYFKLIRSFKKKGYDYNYPLLMNEKFAMHGGSHRLILAIWHGMDSVPVEFCKVYGKHKRYHNKKWLKKCKILEFLSLLKTCKKKIFKKVGL